MGRPLHHNILHGPLEEGRQREAGEESTARMEAQCRLTPLRWSIRQRVRLGQLPTSRDKGWGPRNTDDDEPHRKKRLIIPESTRRLDTVGAADVDGEEDSSEMEGPHALENPYGQVKGEVFPAEEREAREGVAGAGDKGACGGGRG